MKSPCYQCFARYPACHGSCEKYAEFRRQQEEINRKRRFENDIKDYEMHTQARIAARKRSNNYGGRDEK